MVAGKKQKKCPRIAVLTSGVAAVSRNSLANARYWMRSANALATSIDMAEIWAITNAFPCVVVKLPISVVVSPAIALVLRPGMPLVLDNALKLAVVIPAI